MQWPLILRTGFGNVFTHGRWDHEATKLIADAYNSGDWDLVVEWANDTEWDGDEAD